MPHQYYNLLRYIILITISISLSFSFTGLATVFAQVGQPSGIETDKKFTRKFIENQTLTYEETISEYAKLSKHYPICQLTTFGTTDIGKPLHLFVISGDKDFSPSSLKKKQKVVLLINNAIHPGEPEGVDASLFLAQSFLYNSDSLKQFLDKVVVCIIPFFNIDGGLNRGCCSRPNQNGPLEYGFRGNAKNLDLNRDFIKSDAKNTRAIQAIFRTWDPDVFVDNHATNGADYPYCLTLITTQMDKLGEPLSKFLKYQMEPELYKYLSKRGVEMIPYVNHIKSLPEEGIADFMDSPRFSSGYGALNQTISFVCETHKMKPYPQRVLQTYELLRAITKYCYKNTTTITELRAEAKEKIKTQTEFVLDWALDTTQHIPLLYKGYRVKKIPSQVTGGSKLFYDHNEPFEDTIKYFRTFKPTIIVSKPKYGYVLPQAWENVAENLRNYGVKLDKIKSDTLLSVDAYYVESYETVKTPYEGHYLHHNTIVRKENQLIQFYKGDYLIRTNQVHNRFIIETLEPQAVDSYFAWNFFDGVLMQKEWFSDFLFEENAWTMLQNDPKLKEEFENKKRLEPTFASNSFAQLYYLYKKSPHYEKSHNRIPVFRLEGNTQ